jgi:hypothetical protein
MLFKNLFRKKKSEPFPKWNERKNEDFHFELIDYYFRNKNNSAAFQTINDQLIDDIDFYELFQLIDRTSSKIGQQYLFNKLLVIDSHSHFEEQETLIDYFIHNEEKRIKAQTLFSKLNKRESFYISYLFLNDYIPKPKWFWVIPLLSGISLTALVLTFFVNKVFILFTVCFFVNMAIHFWNKRNIMVYMDSIPQLPLLSKIADELMKWDVSNHSNQTVRAASESIRKLNNRTSFFQFQNKVRSEVEIFIYFVSEIYKTLFLTEPLIVFDLLKKLDNKRADIQTLYEYIGKFDSAISIATIRKEMPYYCKPVMTDAVRSLAFTDVYHPLIPDCVSNSLQTDGRSILLTGSNMSGKTTFIRTVAINILLAQTINTCFAKDFRLAQMRLFSAIRITDDLLNALSYYFEEVLTIKRLLNESDSSSNHIFFLDEIFKGTNTIERIAAGKSVLSYLARSSNNIVFVSTHDIELTDLLSNEYDLYHFTETIQEQQIHFDYKLKPGNLSTTNAIRILEINDYPEKVTTEAIKISNMMRAK